MKWVAIAILALLCSCGRPESQWITLHIVDHEEVIMVAEEYTGETNVQFHGYAIWENERCDIWIVPMDAMNSEWEWERLLGHELRHCFEGSFHD